MNLLLKRIFDILFSGFALIILLPIFIVVCIVIKIDSKGPIMYRQKRLSKDGKLFEMFKFRSMIDGAEKIGTGLFNYTNDYRVTKVGNFLRKSSIDELPQLINVLIGDMSLVGPRPPVSYELGDYETLNSRYKKRFEVLPGITGLAQVMGRNSAGWDIKVDYDNQYIEQFKRQGIILDVKILFKTVINVFSGKDIYEEKLSEEMDDEKSAMAAAEAIILKAHEIEIAEIDKVLN